MSREESTPRVQQCESHLADGSQCPEDAVGKFFVDAEIEGGYYYEGDLWLCDEHKTDEKVVDVDDSLITDGGQLLSEKIVAECDIDPETNVEPHPKLFSDYEDDRLSNALFKLWRKGVLNASWDEEAQETRTRLSEFGMELGERGLYRPYIEAVEYEIDLDVSPTAMEVMDP